MNKCSAGVILFSARLTDYIRRTVSPPEIVYIDAYDCIFE